MKKDDLMERFGDGMITALGNIKCKIVRQVAREMAGAINKVCPESREKSFAITKVEEALMWADTAIVRMSNRQHEGQENKNQEDKKND